MEILGWIMLVLGAVSAFGNLTGGGLIYARGGNLRLFIWLIITAIGGALVYYN